MPRKVFTAGEILTAANLNDVSDQSVMVFDDATARATAIPTPVEGMVTYLKDTDSVEKFDGSNFVGVADPPAILQVVSTTKTDVFTASVAQGAQTAVTGLTATITPSSTSSKILVILVLGAGAAVGVTASLFRGATQIGLGDAAGSRRRIFTGGSGAGNMPNSAPGTFLDNPNTTSSITYSVEVGHDTNTTQTVSINRSNGDSDNNFVSRGVSTITVMEVAG